MNGLVFFFPFRQGEVKSQLSWELISNQLNPNSVLLVWPLFPPTHLPQWEHKLYLCPSPWNNRADVVSVQAALAQFTWLSLSYYAVEHWESDLPKHSFISRPFTTRIKGDRTGEGNGNRTFYLHITTEKLFSKSPETITEWGLYHNIWKRAIQADLANHSNGVFLAQPLRRPLSPDCTAFAKNSWQLLLV